MSMGLKKAIQKRDYNFGEYLPIQPEHIHSDETSDGYRYDYF